jgi:hypothetical protein
MSNHRIEDLEAQMNCRPSGDPKVNYAGFDNENNRYKSLSIANDVEFAVVTDCEEHGYGIFSWHHFKEHALYNAAVTGGKVVPTDRYNGELLTPALATAVVIKSFKNQA